MCGFHLKLEAWSSCRLSAEFLTIGSADDGVLMISTKAESDSASARSRKFRLVVGNCLSKS